MGSRDSDKKAVNEGLFACESAAWIEDIGYELSIALWLSSADYDCLSIIDARSQQTQVPRPVLAEKSSLP